MMISPESYVMMHESDSFEELIKERKSLQREIAHLEKIVFDEKRENEEWMYNPSPDVLYQMNLDGTDRERIFDFPEDVTIDENVFEWNGQLVFC